MLFDVFGALFPEMARNDHFEQRFIRVFATRFCTLEIDEFPRSPCVLGGFENRVAKSLFW
jgi:hypothetical protein